MNWVTFETEGGGLVKVQARHIVAIYDEQGAVNLATTAGGVHTLAEGATVQSAAQVASESESD